MTAFSFAIKIGSNSSTQIPSSSDNSQIEVENAVLNWNWRTNTWRTSQNERNGKKNAAKLSTIPAAPSPMNSSVCSSSSFPSNTSTNHTSSSNNIIFFLCYYCFRRYYLAPKTLLLNIFCPALLPDVFGSLWPLMVTTSLLP